MHRSLFSLVILVLAGQAADNRRALRILFGERQEQTHDWSGRVEVTPGKVLALRGWRFSAQDAITGASEWKLNLKRGPFENQPDRPHPLNIQVRPNNVLPAGVEIAVEAPQSANVRVRGASYQMEIPLAWLAGGRLLSFYDGDVLAQETPVPEPISPESKEQHDYPSVCVTRTGTRWVAWQAYENNGDHVYVRSGESPAVPLTERKTDVYRTAIAGDERGRIHAIWSERSGSEWQLRERVHQGGRWLAARTITKGRAPNMSHRLVADGAGKLHLVWIGHAGGQSYVFASRLSGDNWSEPVEVSSPSAWAPAAAADSRGNLWIAWDSYRAGNYDIFLRKLEPGGRLGPEIQVTKSPVFQAHPSIAIDRQDRVWLAWDESGTNWGKDWSHEDSFRGTVLYADRRPQVAVYDGAKWRQTAGDLMAAVPKRYTRFIEMPRIACDPNGRIWLTLELRTLAGSSRTDFWAANGRWEHFLTSLEGDRWQPLMPVSPSSSRPEAPAEMVPAPGGVALAWTHDNRPVTGPGFYAPVPNRHQVMAATMTAPAPGAPVLLEYEELAARAVPVHPDESVDVRRIREYRARTGGQELRILRGDFHRHTEISLDGSGDGSLEDYFRYMLDAALMDTGIIGDHNAGNDDEYSWWRTEKAIDLYLIPGRYTPLFGYERSPAYPNGHRNLVFAQRGVRTLPFAPEEAKGVRNSGPVLYPYLKQNRGIGMLHSLATGQGSDYRDNDPEVEPLVELYQGYHASYEYPGAPRAESDQYQVSVHGAYRPLGFWWRALEKGLKLGVQASSDHIATHNSYTMIYTPGDSREEIVESMRKRHAYAATDNIIIDFRATAAGGEEHLMGDAFRASAAPRLAVKVLGTAEVQEVVVVKDGKFVYRAEPNTKEVNFTFVDREAGGGESYYYVRVVQADRNLAWSSPIWVKYGPG